jgi:nucleoside-diphosphate-sugar epimerase
MVGTMRTVVITGVAGRVGQRLLEHLEADPDVEAIIGIDAREPLRRPRKLRFHRLDLATADLKPLLEGADTIVHLAFATVPPQNDELLTRLNVGGARRLLEAAGGVGARSIVCVSSAMVYGAWPDNQVPLTEDAPLRPNPGVTYAAQKAEVERLLGEWKGAHPGASVAILRPAAAPGATGAGWLTRAWRGAGVLRVRGATPQVQYLHEDDLADAVAVALWKRLDGVYNVAPDGWVPGEDARALQGGFRIPLPEGIVRRILRASWVAGAGDTSPDLVPYLVNSWVVANDRLRAEGWRPTQTSEEAFVASHELPPWRIWLARHRQEAALVGAVALTAGVTGGIIAIVRRRRRNR